MTSGTAHRGNHLATETRQGGSRQLEGSLRVRHTALGLALSKLRGVDLLETAAGVAGESARNLDIAGKCVVGDTMHEFGIINFSSARKTCKGWEQRANDFMRFTPRLKAAGVRRIGAGGGPFGMEAPIVAAVEAGIEHVVEIPISLANEAQHRSDKIQRYVDDGKVLQLHCPDIDTRCTLFKSLADAYIIQPGGWGTLYEDGRVLSRIQLEMLGLKDDGKGKPIPSFIHRQKFGWGIPPYVVHIDKTFWSPMVEMVKQMLDYGTVEQSDLDRFIVADSVEEAIELIIKFKTESWDPLATRFSK